MKIEKLRAIYLKLENDKLAKNFIAQADARFILFGVDEPLENFPKFSLNLDNGLESLAYSYLTIGCSFAEEGLTLESLPIIEKAAKILEHNHLSSQHRSIFSNFQLLISGLAYYASSQYSKSFVILNRSRFATPISEIVYLLLTKKINLLIEYLDKILLPEDYIANSEDKEQNVINFLFAKSTLLTVRYLQYGDIKYQKQALEILDDLHDLSILNSDPAFWYVVRLYRIIVKNFEESSLWTNIQPTFLDDIDLYFDSMNTIEKFISGMVFRDKNPVLELFISQREALAKVIKGESSVVALPTSSGKTKIAEIAILRTFTEFPTSQVLYLAPFRSLAFEMEATLSKSFAPNRIKVSHLYGGGQYSSIDRMLLEESNIIIATPEKAKAILRVNSEFASNVKLIIMDEGHLIDATSRLIQNEIFTEELRCLMKENHGKIVLLSAVLPNSNELSKWISGNEENVVKSDFRPSSQRFGRLLFTGANANLEWLGEMETFNRKFIKTEFNDAGEVVFPVDKRDAVCGVALKMTYSGSVLIFVARSNMINNYARRVLFASTFLKEEKFYWDNKTDWERFKLICSEVYGENCDLIKYAEVGIVCHHGQINKEVRSAMESLMRNGKPKIIISTTTLAQGVNIGVSTVIFAHNRIDRNYISSRDFWNIAGRAGRAFVDSEGKILFAIDETSSRWSVNHERNIFKTFLDFSKIDNAFSGVLTKIQKIVSLAYNLEIETDLLLELIEENDFSKFGESEDEIVDFFDCIDDSLLSLISMFELKHFEEDDWLSKVFETSLSTIQEKSPEDKKLVVKIFLARSAAVVNSVRGIENKVLIASGIPLASAIRIYEQRQILIEYANVFFESSQELEDYLEIISKTETIIRGLPSSSFKSNFQEIDINEARPLWINGEECTSFDRLCASYFGFTLPWAINAISKILKSFDYDEEASLFELLALMTELGLPNMRAIKVYTAGINSRKASIEISQILDDNLLNEFSVSETIDLILDSEFEILRNCSNTTARWFVIFKDSISQVASHIKVINSFAISFNDAKIQASELVCREYNNEHYICDLGYNQRIKIDKTDVLNFNNFKNAQGIYYSRREENRWTVQSRNPNYRVVELD